MKHPKKNASRLFQASVKDDALELLVYGDIVDASTIGMLESWGYSTDGFVSALTVKRAFDDSGVYSKIKVRINSPGGNAFEGMAIYSLLTSQGKPVETVVDGIAASSASIIFMAGGVRSMSRTAMVMIHDAWTYCCGNAKDLRKMADTLEKIDGSISEAYVARTGKTPEEIQTLMDEETWLSAADCVAQGFATVLVQAPDSEEEAKAAMAMARKFQALAKLKNVPEAFRGVPAPEASGETDCECECDACQDSRCGECDASGCEDPNCTDCPIQAEAGNESNLSLYEARAAMLQRRATA